VTRETLDGPTHWSYPDAVRIDYHENAELKIGVYEAIEEALENLNGRMMPGDEGWGVSFATEDDKVLFMLKFNWHKFA
jgi:hypothetical protein